MNDWPHQIQGDSDLQWAIQTGYKRPLVATPTGGGKSRSMMKVIERPGRVHLYTNRIMLREQLAKDLERAGIPFGQIAAGCPMDLGKRVQLCSVQTVDSRFTKRNRPLPTGDIMLVDEAHNNGAGTAQAIMDHYPTVVGYTATPVGLGGVYDHLIIAGTNSELRRCGALVPAKTYAPDCPDFRAYKSKAVSGTLQIKEELKEQMLPTIFGSVLDHWLELNPEQKPTILFAPGVQESKWFAEQFTAHGISAAHIDGKDVVVNGRTFPSSREIREELMSMSENGAIKVITNRFVMREGINMPWLAHGIFACTYGSISAYLQSGGRILRAHPSLDGVIIQDHGGNAYAFGSLNEDREWSLEDTDKSVAEARQEKMRENKEPEPITCPACSAMRLSGATCPTCGFHYEGRRRMVVQTNGKLVPVEGRVFKKRRVSNDPSDVKAWKKCYFRMLKSGGTFKQAVGLFAKENRGKYPNPEWEFMPKERADYSMRVKDVPRSSLVDKPKEQPWQATTESSSSAT